MCNVCVLLIYTISISVLCVSQKDLVSMNQIKYMTYLSEYFLKIKDIMDLCKVNSCFKKLFILFNKVAIVYT